MGSNHDRGSQRVTVQASHADKEGAGSNEEANTNSGQPHGEALGFRRDQDRLTHLLRSGAPLDVRQIAALHASVGASNQRYARESCAVEGEDNNNGGTPTSSTQAHVSSPVDSRYGRSPLEHSSNGYTANVDSDRSHVGEWTNQEQMQNERNSQETNGREEVGDDNRGRDRRRTSVRHNEAS